MKLRGLIKLSIRSYRSRPLRTFLTIFGMSIGMSTVLFLVSLGYGLQNELLKRVTTDDSLYTLGVHIPALSQEPKGISQEMLTSLLERGDVEEVSGARIVQGLARVDEMASVVSLSEVDDAYMRLTGIGMVAGENFSTEKPGVVVSIALARVFGVEPDFLVGKNLGLRLVVDGNAGALDTQEEYPIVGVFDSAENSVFLLSGTSQTLIDQTSLYQEARVRTYDRTTMEQVRSYLVDLGYEVSVIADIVRQVETFFMIVQFILGLFGVTALIVSSVGMFNTMTVALMERTREIGIMKSIGATDAYVSVLFMMESFTMGILGGIFGIMMAFLEMELVNIGINFLASRFGGSSVDIFSSPFWFLLLILTTSGVVGLITGFFPARRASKLDPLVALKYN